MLPWLVFHGHILNFPHVPLLGVCNAVFLATCDALPRAFYFYVYDDALDDNKAFNLDRDRERFRLHRRL